MVGLTILAIVLLFVCVAIILLARYMVEIKGKLVTALVILLGAASVLLVGWGWTVSYHHEHWAVCHVTRKDEAGKGGDYRIHTSDCNTLADDDSYLRAKFNASYIWTQIEPGEVYRFRIVGSYLPRFKQYPNIMQVLPSNS